MNTMRTVGGKRALAKLLVIAMMTGPMLVSAAWSQGKGHGKGHDNDDKHGSGAPVVVVFTPEDRDIVSAWFWQNRNGLPPGLANRESLPPGLRKQLQRNGTLPPGLQKKLTPIPAVLDAKLVRLPVDIIRVVIGPDLVLLNRRTNLVLDIIPDVIRVEVGDRRYTDRDRDNDDDQGEDGYRRSSQPPVYASRAPAPAPASAPAPSKPAWHAGTASAPVSNSTMQQPFELTVRITNSLSTATAKPGERFVATLEQPIYEGTRMIARQGAPVEGEVVDSDKGGRVSGVASLTLKLTRIQTVTGKYVDVSSDPMVVDANSTKGKDVTKIAIVSALGTAVGALAGGGKGAAIGAASGAAVGTGVVLATRGDPAVIPSESLLQFALRSY
jgi:hypothetical protein